MGTEPQFAATILVGAAVLSATADSSYTAPVNSVTVVTAGASGSRIEEVNFCATGVTVNGVTQLFLYDGTVYHPYWPQLISAISPSNTVAPFFATVQFDNLELPVGWSLKASSFVASQKISVVAFGGSL